MSSPGLGRAGDADGAGERNQPLSGAAVFLVGLDPPALCFGDTAFDNPTISVDSESQ